MPGVSYTISPVTFNPSILPSGQRRLLTEARITYEESDDPPIAIAPPGFGPTLAMMWAQSHDELMMLRDSDGAWMLFYFAVDNEVKCEKFHGMTGRYQATTRMREWLDEQGLILPADL
jgi:hypothetical protein